MTSSSRLRRRSASTPLHAATATLDHRHVVRPAVHQQVTDYRLIDRTGPRGNRPAARPRSAPPQITVGRWVTEADPCTRVGHGRSTRPPLRSHRQLTTAWFEPTRPGRTTKPQHPGRPRGRLIVIAAGALGAWLALPSLVLGIVAVGLLAEIADDQCSVTNAETRQAGPGEWSDEQISNARLIISVVMQRGLPPRAAVVALATAIAESGLRNLHGGDRDSLGLFQQRPSQGWGRPGAILDPTYSTNQFLDHLMALSGWTDLGPGRAEQLIQRSAHPHSYAPHEPAAAGLVARYWSNPNEPSPLSSSDAAPRSIAASRPARCAPTGAPAEQAHSAPPGEAHARAAVAFALKQIGKPYVWGGAGPKGFDCSGLVQASWAAAGIHIGRTTSTQVDDGSAIASLDQLQPADLLFIPGDEGTPSHPRHVGLYTGHGLVVDAYSSQRGIILEPLASWTPKIVAVRRIIPPAAIPTSHAAPR